MSSAEVTEWAGYEGVTGPLGQERDDVLAAMVAFYVVSALSGKKGRRLKLDKLMPRWGRRQRQSADVMEQMAKSLTAAHGGKINA